MKSKKNILLILLFSGFVLHASAQNSSPYVETLIGYINNSGFKSTSLRSSAVARPVPVHLSTDAINRTVSPRFAIALADCTTGLLNPLMNWATACGWTSAANASSASGVLASPATGCQAYSELGAPAGTWRVPTQRELMIIYLVRKELVLNLTGFIDFLLDGTQYWSSSTNAAGEAWAMDFSSGVMYNRAKTTTYRVRCIRDIP